MNKKSIVKKVALSALLLTATASTGISYAAGNGATDQAIQVQPSKVFKTLPVGSAASSISKFADPLELAKIYAPDTVDAWKSVLDKLPKVSLEAVPFNIEGVSISATPLTDEQIKKIQKAELAQPQIVDGKVSIPTDGKHVTTTVAYEKGASVESRLSVAPIQLTDEQIKEFAKVEVGQAQIVEGKVSIPAGSTNVTTVSADKANDGTGIGTVQMGELIAVDSPIFKSQLKLEKAAESKNGEQIRVALAELLEQYQQELAK
jgi:hypothetical protein